MTWRWLGSIPSESFDDNRFRPLDFKAYDLPFDDAVDHVPERLIMLYIQLETFYVSKEGSSMIFRKELSCLLKCEANNPSRKAGAGT